MSPIDKKDAFNPMIGSSYNEKSPENFNAEEIQKFLSKFYLIKTKHGYILGRNHNQSKRHYTSPMEWPMNNLISFKNLPTYKGIDE